MHAKFLCVRYVVVSAAQQPATGRCYTSTTVCLQHVAFDGSCCRRQTVEQMAQNPAMMEKAAEQDQQVRLTTVWWGGAGGKNERG
jgi:hypothetical protein